MLRRDLAGSENLTVILFIIAAIVIVGGFIIGTMNPLFTSGEAAQAGVEPLDMFGDVEIGATWTTSPTSITWSDATDDPFRATGSMIAFTYSGSTTYIDIIRNNTEYLPGGTDWYSKYEHFIRGIYGLGSNVAISYNAIENATEYDEDGTVYAIIYPGYPYNSTTAFLVEFEDDSTEAMVNSQLWANNTYDFSIVWITSSSYETQELAWYTVGFQIATFQFSPTGTAFDFIFSAFFDMLIITGVIVIASRLLHGG